MKENIEEKKKQEKKQKRDIVMRTWENEVYTVLPIDVHGRRGLGRRPDRDIYLRHDLSSRAPTGLGRYSINDVVYLQQQ